jgi:hypothetical protein
VKRDNSFNKFIISLANFLFKNYSYKLLSNNCQLFATGFYNYYTSTEIGKPPNYNEVPRSNCFLTTYDFTLVEKAISSAEFTINLLNLGSYFPDSIQKTKQKISNRGMIVDINDSYQNKIDESYHIPNEEIMIKNEILDFVENYSNCERKKNENIILEVKPNLIDGILYKNENDDESVDSDYFNSRSDNDDEGAHNIIHESQNKKTYSSIVRNYMNDQ